MGVRLAGNNCEISDFSRVDLIQKQFVVDKVGYQAEKIPVFVKIAHYFGSIGDLQCELSKKVRAVIQKISA